MSAFCRFSMVLLAAAGLALITSSAQARSNYHFNFNHNDCYGGGYQSNQNDFQHQSFNQCFNDFGYQFNGFNCNSNSFCSGSSFNYDWPKNDCNINDTPDCGDWNSRGCWDWDHNNQCNNDWNWPTCGDHHWPDCNWDKDDHDCHVVPSPMAAWAGLSLMGGLGAVRSLRRGSREIEDTF